MQELRCLPERWQLRYGLTHSGPSVASRDRLDPLCGTEFLKPFAAPFLEKASATDPDASPIFANVSGLSPALVQMGENKMMLSGGITLAEHLPEQRVRVTLEVWPECSTYGTNWLVS